MNDFLNSLAEPDSMEIIGSGLILIGIIAVCYTVRKPKIF